MEKAEWQINAYELSYSRSKLGSDFWRTLYNMISAYQNWVNSFPLTFPVPIELIVTDVIFVVDQTLFVTPAMFPVVRYFKYRVRHL